MTIFEWTRCDTNPLKLDFELLVDLKCKQYSLILIV